MELKAEMLPIYRKITEFVMETPPKGKEEVENHDLVIRTLYFDLVTKAETINFLYENGESDDIGMIFRSFIELYMYLKYILEKNTVNRARACFYWQKYNNIKILNDNLELMDSEEKQLTLKEIDDSLRNSINSHYDDLSTYRDYIETQINSCYTNNTSLRNRKNWWNESADKQSGIRSLFKYLKEEQVYAAIYKKYSTSSHGLSVLGNMDVTKNSIGIKKPSDKDTVFTVLNGYLFGMTQIVVDYHDIRQEVQPLLLKIKEMV
ncbi:hypothetical protein AAFD91_002303 [Enterococcus faecium]